MEVVGRIDRVDKAEDESGTFLRIIDYKSSSKALDLTEVYYGLALQMLTYLDVVTSNAHTWMKKGGTASP
ncbi:PD-(D/E)XK nuclease family protein, partial [Pseudomonas aeruginosa]